MCSGLFRRLFPERRALGEVDEVELALLPEFEDFNALRPRFVGIGHVGGNEEAVAWAQFLGAEADGSGHDVIEAIGIVAVQRQGITRLEPDMREAEAWNVDKNADFVAFQEAGFAQLVHAFALDRRERFDRHAARFHQRRGFAGAKNPELRGVGGAFIVSHVSLPCLCRWWRDGRSSGPGSAG